MVPEEIHEVFLIPKKDRLKIRANRFYYTFICDKTKPAVEQVEEEKEEKHESTKNLVLQGTYLSGRYMLDSRGELEIIRIHLSRAHPINVDGLKIKEIYIHTKDMLSWDLLNRDPK